MRSPVEETLNFIRRNLCGKGELFVGFSGGKDSVVTADLMNKSGLAFKLYYSFTGIDPPEIIPFIMKNYPECEFLRPNRSFWHSLLTHNPPANFSRWCCKKLKKEPSWKIGLKHRVFGIRAEESTRRAKYKRIEIHAKRDHVHYHPILAWKEEDIWSYIREKELAYPELYDQGLSRVGCVICPYHSTAQGKGHEVYREKYPSMFKCFERHCRLWFEKRQAQGKEMFFRSPEEFVENWYKGNVQWYKR